MKVKIIITIAPNKWGTRCIKISNEKNPNENKNDRNGYITLSSIKYFFDSYDFDGFYWNNEDDPKNFTVWLPLEPPKNEKQGEISND